MIRLNEERHTDKTPSLDGVMGFVGLMAGLILVVGKVAITTFGNELGEFVEEIDDVDERRLRKFNHAK